MTHTSGIQTSMEDGEDIYLERFKMKERKSARRQPDVKGSKATRFM